MNNKIESNFSLERATNSVLKLKKDIGKGLIAVGNWLALVKESIPHNEFIDWLSYEVKISRVTAWRYMRIAKEIDYPTLEKLGPAKIYEILEAPKEKQEELKKSAETMTKMEVREEVSKLVEAPKEKPDSALKQIEFIELKDSIDKNLNTMLDVLEELEKEIVDIPDNWKDFVRSQLKMMAKEFMRIHDRI